jgi:putative transposase
MPGPNPSIEINLSDRQYQLLERIVRSKTNSYRLVQRAQLVLFAAQGMNNTEIALQLQLSRKQVRQWRQRWGESAQRLEIAESEGIGERELRQQIEAVLSDEQRPGGPAKFSLEQIVQVVAVACEQPATSGRPVSHWTARELALEVVKRGIVEEISPHSVRRFLKRGHTPTAPQSLLAKCSAN